MKDSADKQTRDLFSAPLTRQQAYTERQKSAGRSQRSFWLTDDEARALRLQLKTLRSGKDD